MSLIEFYRNTITSLGLTITEDDFIMVGGEDKDILTMRGKSVVIPSKEHVNSVFSEVDGEMVATKLLYNPLNENVIKGDTLSMIKTKEIVERRLAHVLHGAGSLLLKLASNQKLQGSTPMYINEFLIKLNDVGSTDKKFVAVDSKSVDLWDKMYLKTVTGGDKFIKIYLKKLGILDGTKYNRLCTTKFPNYTDIAENNDDNKVFGVKLRVRDIKVYKILYEYLLPDLIDTDKIVNGSNNGSSPAYISLMTTYVTVIERLNRIIKALKDVDTALFNYAYTPVSIKLADIEKVEIYKGELLTLPSDLDADKPKDKVQEVVYTQQQQQYQNNQQQVLQQQPIQQQVVQQPETNEDPMVAIARKALYGGNAPQNIPTMVQNVQPQQQQYLPQNTMVAQQQNYNPNVPMSVLMSQHGQQPQQQFQPPVQQQFQQPQQQFQQPQQQMSPYGQSAYVQQPQQLPYGQQQIPTTTTRW